MSQEKPTEDPRERTESVPTEGTDAPWDRAGQASQNPTDPAASKPDLEKWQDTKTH